VPAVDLNAAFYGDVVADLVGSLDQVTDHRRVLASPDVAAGLRSIYELTRKG
jgi:hypothetical protein